MIVRRLLSVLAAPVAAQPPAQPAPPQPGLSADIIAVSGDALQDVRALEKVEFVMARGRIAD